MLTRTEFICSKPVSQNKTLPFSPRFYPMLEGLSTPARVKQEPQTSSAWVLSQGACHTCFEEPLLWKNVVQRGLCSTGWRSPPAFGSGQPYSSLRCVFGAGRSHAVPAHSCTSRFWACFPMDQAAPRSTLCSQCQGQVRACSPFWLCPSLWMPTEPPFPRAKLVPCAFTSPEQTIWNEGAVLQQQSH